MDYEENLIDFLYFESMLAAVGVVKPKNSRLSSNIVENTIKPWKPKSPEEECPF